MTSAVRNTGTKRSRKVALEEAFNGLKAASSCIPIATNDSLPVYRKLMKDIGYYTSNVCDRLCLYGIFVWFEIFFGRSVVWQRYLYQAWLRRSTVLWHTLSAGQSTFENGFSTLGSLQLFDSFEERESHDKYELEAPYLLFLFLCFATR